MHRTEGTNHSNNTFTDGPPATTIEDDWLNAVQEELCYVIEQASITLKEASTETQTQLKEALDTLYVRMVSTPGSAAASGTAGDFSYDSSYVYICIATNTWKRVAISTW